MKPFQPLTSDGFPRRAFLVMPFAFTGLAALASNKDPEVTLVLFSDEGQSKGKVRVPKILKSDAEWRKELSPEEFEVTRHKGTERAFTGRYWKNHEPGIYRCVCCGNALFRSEEKFDSGTGWPSFWAPIAKENIRTAIDMSLGDMRTEVMCRKCDGHLGHVFEDGPPPTGLRYCMNSASLKFIKRA